MELLWVVNCSATNQSNNNVNERDSLVDCDDIQSLAINNGVEDAGLTTFVQEACESVEVLGKYFRPVKFVGKQADIQDLTKFVARPRLISTGTLGATRAKIFQQRLSPAGMLDLCSGGRARFAGAYGLRYTTVFTLQVAATPFHQGVLALSSEYAQNNVASLRSERSCAATYLPHVRLDLSTNTMAVLRVPFLNFTDFVLRDSPNMYTTVAINSILPVPAITGASAPTYKLYMHLEDVEMYGAVPAATRSATPLLASIPVTLPASVEPQSGAVLNREFESETHPLSSGLHSASRTVGWIAKGVPSLSSISGPVSWALGRAAGVLRYFGYSRPQITDPPTRVLAIGSTLEHNVDVPTQCIVLAPTSENRLAVSDAFGNSDVDEMSLTYLMGTFSQLCVGKLSTTDAHGALLYGSLVSPSVMWFRAPTAAPYGNIPLPATLASNRTAFQPTTQFFFASMFKFWRGDIRYRFTFAKTKMHAGRVVATYVPAFIDTATAVVQYPQLSGTGLQPDGYCAIFDLKDGNVFDFVVPYTSPRPFMDFGAHIGSISLCVVDPLLAPSMVASTVDFLVEVAFGNNVELGFPRGVQHPVNIATITEQSGKLLPATTPTVTEYTMGESINSVKQLIMLPKTTRTAYKGIVHDVDMMPWHYMPQQLVSNVLTDVHESYGYGGNIASCFVFVRGSTDYHVYQSQDANNVSACVMMRDITTGNEAIATQLPFLCAHDGTLHFRCPSYQHTIRVPSWAYRSITNWQCSFQPDGGASPKQDISFAAADLEAEYATPLVLPRIRLAYNVPAGDTSKAEVLFRRQAGDDAMLAHFIGPPPVRLRGTDPDISIHEYVPVTLTVAPDATVTST